MDLEFAQGIHSLWFCCRPRQKKSVLCVPYFQEIQAEIKRREEELARSSQNAAAAGSNQGPGSSGNMAEQQGSLWGTALTNIAVIVGFAAFAYTVKYVLRSMVEWGMKRLNLLFCTRDLGHFFRKT